PAPGALRRRGVGRARARCAPPAARARRVAAPRAGVLERLRPASRRSAVAPHDAEPRGSPGVARRARGKRGDALKEPMSKRIHELAKEWNQNPKDLLAMAERVGLRGKRSQSSLTDEEGGRLREGLGLAQRPAVTLGSERVVAERVVTQRDSDADQLVTAIEQTTETRLRVNVIRRRTAREVLKREELPPAVE